MDRLKIQEKIKKESTFVCFMLMAAGYVLLIITFAGILPLFLNYRPEILLPTIIFTVNCAFSFVMAFAGAYAFNEMKSGHSPFTKKTVKYFSIISYAFSFMTFASVALEAISRHTIENSNYFAGFYIPYAICALVFGCLSRVFEYGWLLQQESDETI